MLCNGKEVKEPIYHVAAANPEAEVYFLSASRQGYNISLSYHTCRASTLLYMRKKLRTFSASSPMDTLHT